MELSDLRAFVAVVDEGSTTKAASLLAMTQPGVSKHLARLEENMGGPLFDRSGRSLVLNEFGRIFYKRAKKVLEDVHNLSSMKYGSSCPLGTMNIGLTDSATLIVMPPSLIDFRKCYPGVHISIEVDSSTHIEGKVLNGDCDIGFITSGSKPHHLLDENMLYEDFIDAVVSIDHELAKKKRITFRELTLYTLIMSSPRRRTRQIIDDAFEKNGYFVRDVLDVYVHSAAVRLAEAGLGIALLPRSFVMSAGAIGKCVSLKISGSPISRKLCMIKRKDKPMSETIKFFYNTVLQKSKMFL